jgi:sulfonate transport system substrate-binding protein
LERTDISDSMIGDKQRQAIVGAGGVLKESGIMPDDTDAAKVADALIDPQYVKQVAAAPAK